VLLPRHDDVTYAYDDVTYVYDNVAHSQKQRGAQVLLPRHILKSLRIV